MNISIHIPDPLAQRLDNYSINNSFPAENMQFNSSSQNTYEIEYDRWIDEQVKYLRSGDFSSIDVDNLVEELEALGRAEKSAVKSLVYQILLYSLLIDYWWEEKQTIEYWQAEIGSFQLQLEDRLTTNLKNMLSEQSDRIYQKAREKAIAKSGLKSDRFPVKNPYKIEKICCE